VAVKQTSRNWDITSLTSYVPIFPLFFSPLLLNPSTKLTTSPSTQDLDTSDYLNDSPTLISNAQTIFSNAISNSNPATDEFLVIAHDIHNQTSEVLVEYMLKSATEKGYKPVTVGTCLGDDQKNWYRVDAGSVLGG
jgi:hypothetical protein